MNKNLPPIKLPLALSLLLVLLQSCSIINHFKSPSTLKILHYNVFELDSEKIKEISGHSTELNQLNALETLIKPYDFQLLSINELQYDKPEVPYPSFNTQGKNLETLTKWLRPDKKWSYHFIESNTGNEAMKISPHSYATSKDQGARFYADPNNYGLFPGQYSTGLSSIYPIKKRISIRHLPWSEFNPKVNLNKFRNGVKEKLPLEISLFDKSFMDTIIEVNSRQVHIITFHSVPAYHFGNKRSPNFKRNLDQLRFLEWYLTGKTDIPTSSSYSGVSHLKEDDIYIAMGDWNTDISHNNPGSLVLQRFAKTNRLFPKQLSTWEGKGYRPQRMSMALDYILYSKQLELFNAQVIRPDEGRIPLGCNKESATKEVKQDERSLITYQNDQGQTCYASINKLFKKAKEASDHFPLWAEFKFK